MGSYNIDKNHGLFKTGIETVATSLTLSGISTALTNHHISVRYYSNATGSTTTPTAGTVVITVQDEVTDQFVATSGGLASTDVSDKQSYTGSITAVRAVPTGILTATHWQLFSSSNL